MALRAERFTGPWSARLDFHPFWESGCLSSSQCRARNVRSQTAGNRAYWFQCKFQKVIQERFISATTPFILSSLFVAQLDTEGCNVLFMFPACVSISRKSLVRPHYHFTAVNRNARAQFECKLLEILCFQTNTYGNYPNVEFCRLYFLER